MRRVLALLAVLVACFALTPSAHAFCFGTLHVHVFNDANGNGVLDPGESGRQGIQVQLDQAADGTVESTLTTDANGDVDFFAPAVVIYRVRIVVPGSSVETAADPADLHLTCLGTTNASFALLQSAPALSTGTLTLLALALAAVALFTKRL